MKRLDLHIHTLPSPIEADFEFSVDALADHVKGNQLDVIAITNHNFFDRQNFEVICKALPSTLVLPGIEVSVEKYHTLVIADPENIDSFEELTEQIDQPDENGVGISTDTFVELFSGGSFIIIPHYKKKPAITSEELTRIKDCVTALEVSSDKKWARERKDTSTSVVLFSDFRCSKEGNRSRGQYTYISISDPSFSSLMLAMKDKGKLFITEREDHLELQPGLYASTGLNVVIGSRSSGKTFFLDMLNDSYDPDDVVYVKQFEIVKDAEADAFKRHLGDEAAEIKASYYEPMTTVASAVSKLSSKEDASKALKDYIANLLEFAETSARDDEYSKCPIYSDAKLPTLSYSAEKRVCDAIIVLLEDNPLSAEIESVLGRKALTELLKLAIAKYREKRLKCECVKRANDIAKKIRDSLTRKSSRPGCPESPLLNVAKRQAYIARLTRLRNRTKVDEVVDSKPIGRFKQITKRIQYKNANALKSATGATSNLSGIQQADDCEFVERMIAAEGSPDLSKAFFDMEVLLLNENDEEVSGGQKAEYLFFKALDRAATHDTVLIDEPESSFDNPYLNELIASELKKISEKSTVFIATHNNVLGVSINPDGIVYTAYEEPTHRVYTGDSGDEELVSVDGKTVKRSEVLLRLMEAGDDAYKNRKPYYGIA